MPYNVLITGAGSGLGRGFTRYYLSQPDTLVIAADRVFPDGYEGESGATVVAGSTAESKFHKIIFDVTDNESIDYLVSTTKQIIRGIHTALLSQAPDTLHNHDRTHNHDQQDNYLDLLIHTAGIRGLVRSIEESQPEDVGAAETLDVMDVETMMETYRVNVVGTFMVVRALVSGGLVYPPSSSCPSSSSSTRERSTGSEERMEDTSTTTPSDTSTIRATNNTNSSVDTNTNTMKPKKTKMLIMSSRMGSLTHNSSYPDTTSHNTSNPKNTSTSKGNSTAGSSYAYRPSKTALNMIIRSLAVDLPHVHFSLVHPGRVETGLTRCREEGAMGVDGVVRGIVGWFGRDEGEEPKDEEGEDKQSKRQRKRESGGFWDRFGARIDW